MSIFIGVHALEETTDPLSANPTDTTIRKTNGESDPGGGGREAAMLYQLI
jgi:hypothetical protein